MGRSKKKRNRKYFFEDNDSPQENQGKRKRGKSRKGKNKGSNNGSSSATQSSSSSGSSKRSATKNYSHSSGSSSSGSSNWNTAKKQKVSNPDNVVRTDKGVYELVTSRAWGMVLVPVEDPAAHKVTYDEINGINLIENFPKLPAHLWARWIKLCFHFCPDKKYSSSSNYSSGSSTTFKCWNAIEKRYEEYRWEGGKRVLCTPQPPKELRQGHDPGDEHRSPMGFNRGGSSTTGRVSESGDLEVSCVFARKGPDFKEWRILIPKQKVSGGSVDADFSELCDIETGEIFEGFPHGWSHAGSSHSHNTMGAFFSGTDDRSELGVPGMHIVVGSIDKKKSTYAYKASIVLRQLRKNVDLDDVVDSTPDKNDEFQFHPKVLEMVTTKNHWGGSSKSSSSSAKPAPASSSTPSSSKKDDTEEFRAFWKAKNGYIQDEEEGDEITCSPHFIAWRKRQLQKQSKDLPRKTIGDSDNGVDAEDHCWTDGTDGDYDNIRIPLNEAFDSDDDDDDTVQHTWGLDRIISRYEQQVHRTPLQEDSQWHGL